MTEFVTVKNAAEKLNVSPKTLYRLIEAGKLVKCVLRLPSGRIRVDFGALLEELRAYGELWQRKRRGPSENP
jgi:predicted site-specific integrase-resolvase